MMVSKPLQLLLRSKMWSRSKHMEVRKAYLVRKKKEEKIQRR